MINEEAGFLDALGEDPNDKAARMAYADWLQERNDPRGELLSLECEQEELQKRLCFLQARLRELRQSIDPDWIHQLGGLWCVRFVSHELVTKITAIKLVREVTGYGLRESKELVENLTENPVLVDELSPEEAERIAARFHPFVEVSIEPHRPVTMDVHCYVVPPCRVRLVSFPEENENEVRRLVSDALPYDTETSIKEIMASPPETRIIRDRLMFTNEAKAIVRRFRGIAEVVIEPSHPVRKDQEEGA